MSIFTIGFKRVQSQLGILSFVASSLLTLCSLAQADTTDFGGYSDRFKGGGDKIPPRCQIDLPTASAEPFFVKWNCSDDNCEASEIRTELWIYRNGSPAGELVGNFLGFPASVKIDEGLLGVQSFKQGLPVGIKLLARDRAGIESISPLFKVGSQDTALTTCNLNITTESTESSGSTTGSPALSVVVNDASVNVSQIQEGQIAISSRSTVVGDPCEISSICFNSSTLTFSANLTMGTSETTGTVSVIPGSQVVNVKGSATVDGISLKNVDVSGQTTIDGVKGTLTLNCSK